jgi:hypothetical protein
VTISGTLFMNKDIGPGCKYKVIVEFATIKKWQNVPNAQTLIKATSEGFFV